MKKICVLVGLLIGASCLLPVAGMAQSREDAIRLHEDASALQDKAQSHADLKLAEQKYLQAIAIYQRVGERRDLGIAYNNVGLIYAAWAQYDKAVEYYERSLAIRRELKDREAEGITLNNLGIVYRVWGQYDKAVEYFEKSLAINREFKDREGERQTLNNLGIVYRELAQYDKAVDCYEKSLAMSREFKDRKGEGLVLNNLGVVYGVLGQYDKAVDYYEKSLAISRESKDRKGEGQSLNNLGLVFVRWGQYDKAVDYYEKSLAIERELKDRRGEGQSLNNLGIVYNVWGQYDKAVDYYEKSLAIERELKDRRGEGTTLNNLGVVYRDWGQYGRAVENYKKSLVIKRELKDRKGEGVTVLNVGSALLDRGEPENAVVYFQNGLAIYSELKIPTWWPKCRMADAYMEMGELDKAELLLKEANYDDRWGRFYLMKSDYPKAKEYYGKILKSAEENRGANDLFVAYTGLGAACEALKDHGGAVENYEKAIKLTEEIRSSLSAGEREKFFDVKISGFSRTAPYEGLARVQLRQNKPQEAFKTTEYTVARVFAEAMSRMSQRENFAVPQEIITQDSSLNNELAALKKNLQKAYEKNNKLVIQSLEPQVKDREGKLQKHIGMLRDQYPLFAATKYPEPTDVSASALRNDEWVVAYDVTDTALLIYLIKGKEVVKAFLNPITRADLENLVRKFRQPMEVNPAQDSVMEKLASFDFGTGHKLTDILIKDVISEIPDPASIIIVPDECLGILPFEMLPIKGSGVVKTDKSIPYVSEVSFFGDRNLISYTQSVTALTLARTLGGKLKNQGKALVVADPVFEMDDPRARNAAKEPENPSVKERLYKDLMIAMGQGKTGSLAFTRLPLTDELAKGIESIYKDKSDVLTGLMATKGEFLEKIGPNLHLYDRVIFATHGYYGSDLPFIREPVLALTLVPPGTDGYLKMSEVMSLKMTADVVALTACQTGLGKRISGEGTMGMGRAFQYAGAKSVLMSMWSVSEAASVKLVESFFKHLENGQPKLKALQLARQSIRQAGYDHPFFWASFILAGEVN